MGDNTPRRSPCEKRGLPAVAASRLSISSAFPSARHYFSHRNCHLQDAQAGDLTVPQSLRWSPAIVTDAGGSATWFAMSTNIGQQNFPAGRGGPFTLGCSRSVPDVTLQSLLCFLQSPRAGSRRMK